MADSFRFWLLVPLRSMEADPILSAGHGTCFREKPNDQGPNPGGRTIPSCLDERIPWTRQLFRANEFFLDEIFDCDAECACLRLLSLVGGCICSVRLGECSLSKDFLRF